jgi:hypothetical protein
LRSDILHGRSRRFIGLQLWWRLRAYAKVAHPATNYLAVGHPSTPNYLEITGGSNFGVPDDYWPNWVSTGCVDNAPGSSGCDNAVTPIAVPGFDNPVVATATSSAQCNGEVRITSAPVPHNCARYDYPAARHVPGETGCPMMSAGMHGQMMQDQSAPPRTDAERHVREDPLAATRGAKYPKSSRDSERLLKLSPDVAVVSGFTDQMQ